MDLGSVVISRGMRLVLLATVLLFTGGSPGPADAAGPWDSTRRGDGDRNWPRFREGPKDRPNYHFPEESPVPAYPDQGRRRNAGGYPAHGDPNAPPVYQGGYPQRGYDAPAERGRGWSPQPQGPVGDDGGYPAYGRSGGYQEVPGYSRQPAYGQRPHLDDSPRDRRPQDAYPPPREAYAPPGRGYYGRQIPWDARPPRGEGRNPAPSGAYGMPAPGYAPPAAPPQATTREWPQRRATQTPPPRQEYGKRRAPRSSGAGTPLPGPAPVPPSSTGGYR